MTLFRFIFIHLTVLIVSSCSMYSESQIKTTKIWDYAPHNAFTSLIEHEGQLYLAFREGKKHVNRNGGDDGIIRILKSSDGESWIPVDSIRMAGYDLRDPQLIKSSQGKLMVSFVAATYKNGHGNSYHTYKSVIENGFPVSPTKLCTPFTNDWLWRIYDVDGRFYGFNYITTFDLLSSEDGENFNTIKSYHLPGKATEADFVVKEGKVIAVVNRDNTTGLIGKGRLDNGNIEWHNTGKHFVGPKLLQLTPKVLLFFATEYVTPTKREARIYKINGEKLQHMATLPTQGDCGYMGAAVLGETLFVSYYSTTETGRVAVFLTRIPTHTFK